MLFSCGAGSRVETLTGALGRLDPTSTTALASGTSFLDQTAAFGSGQLKAQFAVA